MRKTLILLSALFIILGSSCTRRYVVVKTHPRTGHLPPGQAKKVTGSQSAKPYAPGQRKKRVRSN